MLNLLIGIGIEIGLLVALLVGDIMQRKYSDRIDAILDLDWDMDGESGEFIARVKKGKDPLIKKIKELLNK